MSYKKFDLDVNPQDDDTPKLKVDEDVVYINLDLDRLERKAKISLKLTDQENELLTNFIQANKDIFVWSAEDIPGMDPFVACHFLHLDLTTRPVIQCKQNHGSAIRL